MSERYSNPRAIRYGVTGLLLATCLCGCNEVAPPPGPQSDVSQLPERNAKAAALEVPAAPAKRLDVAADSSDIQPVFLNIADQMGINFTFYSDTVPDRFLLPEVMGGGAAWIDFDGDGILDLYLMNGAVLQPTTGAQSVWYNALYRGGIDGRFVNVASLSASDDPQYGQGIAAGDFNADGFPDLYLTNYGPNVLLMNNGDGTFSDVTVDAGVGDPRWGSSGVWLDIDGDAFLDLYAVNYLDVTPANNQVCIYGDQKGYCGPGRYDGVPDLVYLNLGSGTFRNAATELGFSKLAGKGLAVIASDFNDDQMPEIYVANDMTANFLYTRSADRGTDSTGIRYEDVAGQSGCAVSGDGMNQASMGISCADFDGDGMIDIYLTDYYQMKNTLYHNLGEMLFEDDSLRTGVATSSLNYLGFGTWPLDYDSDRDPDLFVANGHVLGKAIEPNAMTPQLLQNDGTGNFTDVSIRSGDYFQDRWLGRGVAAADFDDDGDTDLTVTHLERPVALLRNDTQKKYERFIGLALQGIHRLPPICARITVTTSQSRQTQVFSAGGSYLSTSDSRLLFPLNDASETADVEINWPSGRIDRFSALPANHYWTVIEGRSPVVLPR